MLKTKFRKFLSNKLWRDKIVSDLEKSKDSIIHYKILNDLEFEEALKLKLLEESNEVLKAKSNEELIEEFADVIEVIKAFCDLKKIKFDMIIDKQLKKYEERGGFQGRKYVTISEHLEGTAGVEYCLKDSEKYPEVF